MSVSRNDHLKPIVTHPRAWGKRNMAIIHTEYGETSSAATCSCGWGSGVCKRDKVREDKVDRHLRKRHHGQGIRL